MKKPKYKRNQFTFYRSFYDAIKLLPNKEEQADLYNAIFELSFNFTEPETEEKLNQLAWVLIKPNVLKSCSNYINGLQRGTRRSVPAKTMVSSRDIDKDIDKEVEVKEGTPLTLTERVIKYLNSVLDTKYLATSKATQRLIAARTSEGFTGKDFKTVIDKKVAEWKTDEEMSKFLRPETLFSNKFEGYLNQLEGKRKKEKALTFGG